MRQYLIYGSLILLEVNDSYSRRESIDTGRKRLEKLCTLLCHVLQTLHLILHFQATLSSYWCRLEKMQYKPLLCINIISIYIFLLPFFSLEPEVVYSYPHSAYNSAHIFCTQGLQMNLDIVQQQPYLSPSLVCKLSTCPQVKSTLTPTLVPPVILYQNSDACNQGPGTIMMLWIPFM